MPQWEWDDWDADSLAPEASHSPTPALCRVTTMASSRIAQGAKILPSPKTWPIIGTLGALLAAGGAPKLHEYVHKRHQELGPIYREKIGTVNGVFVSSPDYMRRIFAMEGKYPSHVIPESWALYNQTYGQKRGLLFMEGKEWHNFRKLLNNVILKPETVAIVAAVTVAADELLAVWSRDGGTRDLERQLYKWSLQTIVSILIGGDAFKSHQTAFAPMLNELSFGLHGIFTESANLSLLPAKLAQKLRLPPWNRFVHSVNSAFNTAGILMESLKKIKSYTGGLLQQLQKTNMDESDVNRIVIDLILAAGDTTAFTTQWLLYMLAKHPDIQHTLYQEVKALDCKSAVENQLLKGALRETLRLYPVAPFITRYMPDQVEVDGYCLNKGDLVIMSLYTSGREESSFPEPLEFQPDRWLRNKSGYNSVVCPQASLPFAMGARSCIGRKIAETQIATTIAMVLKKFEITLQNPNEVGIKLHLIAVPSGPIELKMQCR